MKLENGTDAVPYYGYDGRDGATAVPAGARLERRGDEDRARQEHLPRLQGRPDGPGRRATTTARTSSSRATSAGRPGSITRINLDADGAHRVTLMATQTDAGVPLRRSTARPGIRSPRSCSSRPRAARTSSIYQATPDFPSHRSTSRTSSAALASRASRTTSRATSTSSRTSAEDEWPDRPSGRQHLGQRGTKQPNSFIYRFMPNDASDLRAGGKLQALQVIVGGNPLKFTQPASSSAADVAAAANTDISGANSAGYVALHTYGTSFATKWITSAPRRRRRRFPGADDNALAKAAGRDAVQAARERRVPAGLEVQGALLRRDRRHRQPHLRRRRPAPNPNLPACTTPNVTGGFRTIFKLVQSPKSDDGTISVLYNGDQAHAGFDNVAFFSKDQHRVRRGRGRHAAHAAERARLRLAVRRHARTTRTAPSRSRFIAEGRDASATIDSGLSRLDAASRTRATTRSPASSSPTATRACTGCSASDDPKPFKPDGKWRAFWTQQHGDNDTWELIAGSKGDHGPPGPNDD